MRSMTNVSSCAFLALLLLGGCGEQDVPEREPAHEDTHAHDEHGEETHAHDEHGEETLAHDEHGEETHAHDEHGEEAHGPAEEDHQEAVRLTSEAIQASGVVVQGAGPREIQVTRSLPGEVVANSDRLAHIVPRFPGITQQVLKGLGDQVREGEPLAVIESNESLSGYEVRSLISGTIIEKHITLGEFVRDDADIFVVADLSTVWINVTVYARDIAAVRPGLLAHVTAVGGAPSATGTIDYTGPVLGEATRAATARLVLPNPKREWRPGMFVTARIVTDQVRAPVAVHDGALQRFEGRDCVFVQEGDAFEPRPVRLGRSDGEWTEILDGLQAGERYVAEGSFIVKSEFLKAEASHDH
jgi:cobalt-zinc-cadmium efflux system membrane fusion protein